MKIFNPRANKGLYFISDFEKLQQVCRKRTLDKSHFEISRVPITNCVIVKNIPEATCRDALEFYFDNKKRSGVSGVLDVKMLDGFCLVYFEEAGGIYLLIKTFSKFRIKKCSICSSEILKLSFYFAWETVNPLLIVGHNECCKF